MRVLTRSAAALILAAVSLAPALAQKAGEAKPADAKPAPAPVPSEPLVTTASYGDWVLRCQRVSAEKDALRVCEVTQSFQVQGQTSVVAQLGVVRAQKTEPLRLTLALPVNVMFPSAPRITFDGKDPVELSWKRCLPSGCIAEIVARDDILKQLKGFQGATRIESKDSMGRDFALSVSLRGLSQALDALAKEP